MNEIVKPLLAMPVLGEHPDKSYFEAAVDGGGSQLQEISLELFMKWTMNVKRYSVDYLSTSEGYYQREITYNYEAYAAREISIDTSGGGFMQMPVVTFSNPVAMDKRLVLATLLQRNSHNGVPSTPTINHLSLDATVTQYSSLPYTSVGFYRPQYTVTTKETRDGETETTTSTVEPGFHIGPGVRDGFSFFATANSLLEFYYRGAGRDDKTFFIVFPDTHTAQITDDQCVLTQTDSSGTTTITQEVTERFLQ
jgi:hypothetical protein